jgi:hypothetical protein
MALNSDINVGARRFIRALNAHRNFEPGGTQQYLCNKEGMNIGGVVYHVGDALPLGILPDSQLEVLFISSSKN